MIEHTLTFTCTIILFLKFMKALVELFYQLHLPPKNKASLKENWEIKPTLGESFWV